MGVSCDCGSSSHYNAAARSQAEARIESICALIMRAANTRDLADDTD